MEHVIQLHIEKLPEGVYLATSDEVQGLVAQGRTIQETIEIARDVAKKLLEHLRQLVEGVDWVRGQETRGAVLSEIRVRLNDLPELPYPQALWDTKVDQV